MLLPDISNQFLLAITGQVLLQRCHRSWHPQSDFDLLFDFIVVEVLLPQLWFLLEMGRHVSCHLIMAGLVVGLVLNLADSALYVVISTLLTGLKIEGQIYIIGQGRSKC